MTVVNFKAFKEAQKQEKQANLVHELITTFEIGQLDLLREFNLENPDTAFDVATIQFLMRGVAHRLYGETHPSQRILDSMKEVLYANQS